MKFATMVLWSFCSRYGSTTRLLPKVQTARSFTDNGKKEPKKEGDGKGKEKGPGDAGDWPSTTGNPSGGNRSNNPPKDGK